MKTDRRKIKTVLQCVLFKIPDFENLLDQFAPVPNKPRFPLFLCARNTENLKLN